MASISLLIFIKVVTLIEYHITKIVCHLYFVNYLNQYNMNLIHC